MRTEQLRLLVSVFALLIGTGLTSAGGAAAAPTTRPTPDEVLKEVRERFTLRGRPIHPSVLYRFNPPQLGEGPITLAVDVSAALSAEVAEMPIVAGEKKAKYHFIEDDLHQWFGYEYLGVLNDGTAVVRIDHNGGGTGTFSSLLMLRFEMREISDGEGPRLLMRLVKSAGLGDRAGPTITLHGDRAVVEHAKYRNGPRVVRPD